MWENVCWWNSKMIKPVIPRLHRWVDGCFKHFITNASGWDPLQDTNFWMVQWIRNHVEKQVCHRLCFPEIHPTQTGSATSKQSRKPIFMSSKLIKNAPSVPTDPTFWMFPCRYSWWCFQLFLKWTLVFITPAWQHCKELCNSIQSSSRDTSIT